MNKVYGGTVRHHGESSMCLSCRNAQVVTNRRGVTVYCTNLFGTDGETRVEQPVYECSAYDDKRHPTRNEYMQIGWVLNTSKSGEVIGFLNPKEWKRLNNRKDDEE